MAGETRIGLREGLLEDAVARAFGRTREAVGRAHMLGGDIGIAAVQARTDRLAEARFVHFAPIGMMLATPVGDLGEVERRFPAPYVTQDKYDGVRTQVHRHARDGAGDRRARYWRRMTALAQAEQLALILALQRDLALEGNVDMVLQRITGTATKLLGAERATVSSSTGPVARSGDGAGARHPTPRTARRWRSGCRSTGAGSPRRSPAAVARWSSTIPVALTEDGLGAAVSALAERMDGMNGSRVAVRDLGATRRACPEVEAGAFAVIRGAANNAVKTGRAPHVWLDVVDAADGIVARIDDDGAGFDVSATLAAYATRCSLGLLQMRESARLVSGRLKIDSSPGQGTRVHLWVPA